MHDRYKFIYIYITPNYFAVIYISTLAPANNQNITCHIILGAGLTINVTYLFISRFLNE